MSLCDVDESVIQDSQEAPFSKRTLMKKMGNPTHFHAALKSVHKDK
jgi:hypothetical protein